MIVATTLGLAVAGHVSWAVGLTVSGLAASAELAEFAVVARFGRAFGGSGRAFWGAVIGGTVGLFMGLPIPLVGPVLTAFLGSFAGAGAVTFAETRSVGRSARVGWGVLLARTVAVGLKTATAFGVIAAVGLSLLL